MRESRVENRDSVFTALYSRLSILEKMLVELTWATQKQFFLQLSTSFEYPKGY